MAGYHQFLGSVNPQFPNSSFGDTTHTKVFVGGLAWETQSETLRRHFEQYGEILEAVVITDKNTGRSKGYGFVTFRDPESARQTCLDPNPVIDGRRANCNLASEGRPRPAPPYGRSWPSRPFYGNVPGAQVAFVRNPTYHQSLSYGYQQGYACPSYGYAAYGPEYVYPQNVYGPSVGQLYVPMYGTPSTFNAPIRPITQLGQAGQQLPGAHGYAALPGFAVPSHQIIQLGGPNVNEVTTSHITAIPAPFPSGVAAPVPGVQTHFLIPVHSRQFSQGASGSDQTAG